MVASPQRHENKISGRTKKRNGPEFSHLSGYIYLELQLRSQKVGLWRGSVLGPAGLEREQEDKSVPDSLLE